MKGVGLQLLLHQEGEEAVSSLFRVRRRRCRGSAGCPGAPRDSWLLAAMGQDRGLAGANTAVLQGKVRAMPQSQPHLTPRALRPGTCSRCWRAASGMHGALPKATHGCPAATSPGAWGCLSSVPGRLGATDPIGSCWLPVAVPKPICLSHLVTDGVAAAPAAFGDTMSCSRLLLCCPHQAGELLPASHVPSACVAALFQ